MIDIGKLTPEETKELLLRCAAELTEEQLFEALEAVLTVEQKEELGEVWFNIDR